MQVTHANRVIFFNIGLILLLAVACGDDPLERRLAETQKPPVASATPAPTATPVSAPTPTAGPTAPVNFDQTGLNSLLPSEAVAAVLPGFSVTGFSFTDFGVGAASVDPAQMDGVDSFTGLSYQGSSAGVTFVVMDFVSSERALEHLAKIISESDPLDETTPTVGDTSLQGRGGGVTVVFFVKGELVVLLTASGLPTTDAELEALLSLAGLVETRL